MQENVRLLVAIFVGCISPGKGNKIKNKQMGHQTKKVLQSKEKHQQDKTPTQGMGEYIRQYI